MRKDLVLAIIFLILGAIFLSQSITRAIGILLLGLGVIGIMWVIAIPNVPLEKKKGEG